MVRIPPINNDATARSSITQFIQQIGITLFLDLVEEKKEAYFLDVENGVNPAGAIAFRLTNNPNDILNFFTGQPLTPTPTVQEVIQNPVANFQRLMVGTNLDVRRAIEADPDSAPAINAGLQQRRSAGESLVQVITNAVNADKETRRMFDQYLRDARDFAIDQVQNATVGAVAGLDENLGRLVTGLSDFVIEAAFARQRRSGDGRRVSKEVHEYNYLSQTVIESYGTDILGVQNEAGFTHLQVALLLLQRNFTRPADEEPGLVLGSEASQFPVIQDIADELFFDIPPETFDANNFSYGNFIDSYHMRRLLAELKKLVQDSRLDNITDFLRRSGTTRPAFLNNTLFRLAPNGFISAAGNEFIINSFLNPTRPVRDFVAQNEIVQAFLPGGDDNRVAEGPLLTFTNPAPRVAARQENLTPVDREQ